VDRQGWAVPWARAVPPGRSPSPRAGSRVFEGPPTLPGLEVLLAPLPEEELQKHLSRAPCFPDAALLGYARPSLVVGRAGTHFPRQVLLLSYDHLTAGLRQCGMRPGDRHHKHRLGRFASADILLQGDGRCWKLRAFVALPVTWRMACGG